MTSFGEDLINILKIENCIADADISNCYAARTVTGVSYIKALWDGRIPKAALQIAIIMPMSTG